jgi:RNA polymerase sigma-70 factor (sigma-E family)
MEPMNPGEAIPIDSISLLTDAVPRTWQAGTGLSFDDVYAAEYAGFVRLAVLLVDHQTIAEELVQDAFVGASRRWSSLDDPVRYVRQSVVNRARSELRRRAVLRREQRLIATPDSTSDAPQEMFDAIAHLNARQRSVIVLRYWSDLSEAEIADTLGMRPGTVKSTLSRAIDRLREEIPR